MAFWQVCRSSLCRVIRNGLKANAIRFPCSPPLRRDCNRSGQVLCQRVLERFYQVQSQLVHCCKALVKVFYSRGARSNLTRFPRSTKSFSRAPSHLKFLQSVSLGLAHPHFRPQPSTPLRRLSRHPFSKHML